MSTSPQIAAYTLLAYNLSHGRAYFDHKTLCACSTSQLDRAFEPGPSSKLYVRNRAQAAARARELGLL